MRKLPLLITSLLLATALVGCSSTASKPSSTASDIESSQENAEDMTEAVEDPGKIEDMLGASLELPEEDSSYSIIAQSIGETKFSKDGKTYDLRSSKDLVSDSMAGILSPMNEETTKKTVNDVEVNFTDYEDGTLIAFWTTNSLNYTLTSADADQKTFEATVQYVFDQIIKK